MELTGCTALVTGGSGGLGQRICRALALNGVNVVVNYAVSKAGMIHLTKCMAVGLAPAVTVNSIAPGFMEGTRMSANWSPAYAASAAERTLLRRTVDKDDVAEQLITLCRSDSITGQTILMDSGRV